MRYLKRAVEGMNINNVEKPTIRYEPEEKQKESMQKWALLLHLSQKIVFKLY